MVVTVVVLGQHRGGTSIVAGILHTLGIRMDPANNTGEWPVRNWKNPTGFFENQEFVRLNQRILDTGEVSDLRVRPAWFEVSSRIEPYLHEIEDTIRRNERPLWGWKDPLLVLDLEYFMPYLTSPMMVVVTRNPLDVAESMSRRDGVKREDSLRVSSLWSDRLDVIQREYPETPTIVISYENIIRDPTRVVSELASFLGIRLTRERLLAAAALVQKPDAMRRRERESAASGFRAAPQRNLKKLKGLVQGNRPSDLAGMRRLLTSAANNGVELLRSLVYSATVDHEGYEVRDTESSNEADKADAHQ